MQKTDEPEAWTRTRSRLANALKADPTADVTDLRRQLKAERLQDYISRTIDAAPPLTDDQREQLARLLQPALSNGGGRVA